MFMNPKTGLHCNRVQNHIYAPIPKLSTTVFKPPPNFSHPPYYDYCSPLRRIMYLPLICRYCAQTTHTLIRGANGSTKWRGLPCITVQHAHKHELWYLSQDTLGHITDCSSEEKRSELRLSFYNVLILIGLFLCHYLLLFLASFVSPAAERIFSIICPFARESVRAHLGRQHNNY